MSLYITSLNSGSNGNCYYIGNETEAVLIDAGISCRETERRMRRLGLSMQRVKAIFVSHEHIDHIKGIPVLARKHQLPVYITESTRIHGRLDLQESLARPFTAYEPVQVGALAITAFPKFHDAVEPHSFMISADDVNIGVFTDIGAPCEHLVRHFKQCHAAFLETNYDETMLEKGRYPYYLKNRIRGGQGHLSNTQALELFKAHRPAFMSHLFLSHLSQDNNNPELVLELFRRDAAHTEIIVASRHVETAVYRIGNNVYPSALVPQAGQQLGFPNFI
ncbi:MBL fold metallo-hydrolase [Chitinophaga vietnamensis]|uniref:MBL fold metallo-hydrolase n=1 Tax=Chitinophaga vietnamensis TaxID=2593957 RepID=UPI001177336F|nr:MBL fold metallo-hydrolase [Chitinophaga vietnamensis]